MTQSAETRKAPARRFVHLGDRLQAIARIRAGAASTAEVAAELGVSTAEVRHWLEVHAAERTVTFEELRASASPEMLKLERRAQRLAGLLAQTERLLRELHQELTSKQFGENPHLPALRVVHAQPPGD
jgi:transposase-like protein